VGQIRWSDVKDLPPQGQLIALRASLQIVVRRIETKRRKPKDFAWLDFPSAIDALLEQAPEEILVARPAAWVMRDNVLDPSSTVIEWVGEIPFVHNDLRYARVGRYMFSQLDEWVERVV
jgi:hypothetical protein